MSSMPLPPNFTPRDINAIRMELINSYQTATGRTLYPAQVEMIWIETLAYRILLLENLIQAAATQNLVSFASAPVLDYLGELVGVTRLGATAATCRIQFDLVLGHAGVVIPAGTRVSSTDGRAVFQTLQAVPAATGASSVQTDCVCLQVGSAGNGYTAATISTILDPQAYITRAFNINPTAGGAEQETDDELRERIRLAPASFSTAGSVGAYKYHAKSANPNIVDVFVDSLSPGVVNIYPLMGDGSTTPTQILNAVQTICSADKVRPLTDTVVVQSPTRKDYLLNVDLILYDYADASLVVTAVQNALQTFVDARRTKLGLDVVSTQIIAVCQIDGVYKVELPTFVDISVQPNEFPYCVGFNVQVVGTTTG